MSANNTPSWWASTVGTSTAPAITTAQSAFAQNQLAQYTTAASTVSYIYPTHFNTPLDPETAANLITQFEDDRSLLDDKGRLKFGKYRHKRLCEADLEYLVSLGRAINKVRQGIAKDIRARRALARLTQ